MTLLNHIVLKDGQVGGGGEEAQRKIYIAYLHANALSLISEILDPPLILPQGVRSLEPHNVMTVWRNQT